MKCDDAIRDLPLLVYGELSFDEEEAVEQHLEGCVSCREELAQLKKLHEAIDQSEIDIPAGMLTDCRRQLRGSIHAIADTVPVRRKGLLGVVQDALSADWTAWLRPAGAIALVAIGFFGARLVPDREAPPQIVTQPASLRGEGPIASRVRFVEPDENGRVRILLEETHQRTLSGNTADDQIQRILLRTARDASDPGLRVDSVDLLSSSPDSDEVRGVLLHALQHDPNSGVRLKALDGLRSSASHPATRQTLARVLLTDDNPGVRTQAIDLLIQRETPEVVGVLQEALRRDNNNYVRLKCERALHEMGAPVESF